MNYKELSGTGIKLPPIVFGTSALGNLYVALTEETKLTIIKECLRYVKKPVVFDCAGKYGAGLALEMLGKCLHKLHIKPADVTISNKLGWYRTPLSSKDPTFEKDVWKNLNHDAIQMVSYEGIMKCWEQGNELLGGKYKPQMVSVHDPDEYLNQAKNDNERKRLFKDICDAYHALSDLKKQGKVGAIGIGAKNWRIIKQISESVDLDWVMFANSMTIMNHPQELLEFMADLHHRGKGMINSAVFHGGFLTGSNYFDYRLITRETEISKFQWRDTFFDLCKKYNIAPAVACVNFGMTPPGVVSISLNTSNPDHVKRNVKSVMTEVPEEFWKIMKEKELIREDYPYL